MSEVIQFPYSASRRIHSRKPRRSKNGTPEERAAKAAAEAASSSSVTVIKAPRRTNSAAMARRREFREVIRARIKDVAASRGLSDAQIKQAMTGKHFYVFRFAEEHGVNLDWLIAGEGRIFKSETGAIGKAKQLAIAAARSATVTAMRPRSATTQARLAMGDPADPNSEVRRQARAELVAYGKRLRTDRWSVWYKAENKTRYWHAMMKLHFEIYIGQRDGLIEALRNHPKIEWDEHFCLLGMFREAEAAQLLTPAPCVAKLNWKRAALARGHWRYTDVTVGQIQKAIDDDERFLKMHQPRQSRRGAS